MSIRKINPNYHKDERRIIIDITPRVKHYIVSNTKKIRLGDHYYTNTGILFYALQGEIKFKLEGIKSHTKERGILKKGEEMIIKPYTVVTFFPEPKAEFLVIYRKIIKHNNARPYKIEW